MIPTINFHLIKACNFKCKFCYATFNDICEKGLTKGEQFDLIESLAQNGLFRKINFAGGEPTLVPHIRELIEFAKSLGFETSIVTNASRIDFEWVRSISRHLDILTLSVDSIKDETNRASGRNRKQKTIDSIKLGELAKACHLFGVNLKVNTVVTQFNQDETLVGFINELQPFRWKILQATRVEGQNDTDFEAIKVSSDTFSKYCKRNQQNLLPGIKLIEESENLISGSYLMIDQLGRFFDSNNRKHNYSDAILSVGVKKALQQVSINESKFSEREGNYSTIKTINTCTS
jgi:radical S-adenosyl methionine domain-containing protein 2